MQEIKFGDVICIGDAEARGFLTGDPYLTDDVFVDSYHGFDLQCVGPNQLQCLFIIEHAYEFSAAKAFHRKLRKIPVRVTEKTWKTEVDSSDSLYVELEQLQARKEDEKATNEVEAKRIAGLPVCYGSHVQLRHLSSKMFLTQSKNRAALNALALEVYLAAEGSKWSIWKLVPTVRIRGDGESVHYGEEVSFASVKQRSSYLSTFVAPDLLAAPPQNQSKSAISTKSPKACDEAKIIQPEGVTQRFEVNSSASWTKFHLLLVRRHQQEGAHTLDGVEHHPAIRSTDVITICHKQHDLFLVADEAEGVRWQPRADAWFDSERPKARAMWTMMSYHVDQGSGYLHCPSQDIVIHHLATGMGLQAADNHAGKQGKLTLRKAGRGQSKWAMQGQEHVRETSKQGAVHEGDFVWLKAVRRKGKAGGYLSVKGAKASKQNNNAFSPGVAYEAVGETRTASCDTRGGEIVSRVEKFEACLRDTSGGELLDMVELSIVDPMEWRVADLVRRAAQGLRHIKYSLSIATHRPKDSHSSRPCCPDGSEPEAVSSWFAKSDLRETLLAIEHASDVSFGVLCAICDPRAHLPASRTASAHAPDGHKPRPRHGVLAEQWRGHGLGSLCHREMLRDLGVLDAAIGLAMVALEECGVPARAMSSAASLQGLLARCFRLVELACKGSTESKQAMAAALPIMQAALVADCGAYAAMLAVYAGTRQLLEGLHHEVFRDTVTSIVNTRLPSVLSFAIETCICEGEPIKTNQDRWATVLFPVNQNHTPPVFLDVIKHRTRIGEEEKEDYLLGTWKKQDGRRMLLSLSKLTVSLEGIQGELVPSNLNPDAVVEYHCSAMELLCAMLRGGNALPRTLVAAHSKRLGLESTQLVSMISNDDLPSTVRARCVKVLQYLYVEQTPVKLPMRNSALWVWRRLGALEGDRPSAFGAPRERLLWGGEDAMEQCKKVKDVVTRILSNVKENPGKLKEDCELEKSLVSLLAALFQAGYYHRAENGELIVDIAQVSALGHPLMGVLDDRSFTCNRRARDLSAGVTGGTSPFQAPGGVDSGRALVELKVSTLKLLGQLIDCCWESKIELLFAGWELVLTDSLDCHGWQDLLAATNDAVQKSSSSDQQGLSPENAVPHRVRGFKPHLQRPRRFFKRDEWSLSDYASNPALWKAKPPWRTKAVIELGKRIFEKHPFMAELSYNELLLTASQQANQRLPDVLKIVLWQLMFNDITLKESTLHFLFQTFQQHTTFLSRVREAKFICQPGTFEILPTLIAQANNLRAISRTIRDGALPIRQPSNFTTLNSRTTLASSEPEADVPPGAPFHLRNYLSRRRPDGSDSGPDALSSYETTESPTGKPRVFASWQNTTGPDGTDKTRDSMEDVGALHSPSGMMEERLFGSLSSSHPSPAVHTTLKPSKPLVSWNLKVDEVPPSPTSESSRGNGDRVRLGDVEISPHVAPTVAPTIPPTMQSLQTPRSVTESVTEEATPLALLDAFESDAAGVRQSEPTSSRALEFGGPEKEEGLSAPGPWLLKPEEAEDQAQACVMSTLTAVAVLNNADANGGTLRSVEDQQAGESNGGHRDDGGQQPEPALGKTKPGSNNSLESSPPPRPIPHRPPRLPSASPEPNNAAAAPVPLSQRVRDQLEEMHYRPPPPPPPTPPTTNPMNPNDPLCAPPETPHRAFEHAMQDWYRQEKASPQVRESASPHLRESADITFDAESDVSELRRSSAEARSILHEWAKLCHDTAASGEHSAEELSHVMQVLQIDSILLSLLTSCPTALHSGLVDAETEECLTKMVSVCCSVVSTLCSSSATSHEYWSGHAEVLWQFVGTPSVDAESTLAVIAADNLDVLSKHGKEWISRYFRLVGENKSGPGVTVRGLKFLTRLLTYKGTSMPEHNVRALAYFEDQERAMEALMKGDDEWDRRIALMKGEAHLDQKGSSENDLALHLASVDFLAAACVGKSTAAAVYTSHFLPFKHVLRTLLAMHRDSQGFEHSIPPRIKIRVKASFLRLLFHVFLETKVQHLLADRHRQGSGMWNVNQRDPTVAGTEPLMDTLVSDIHSFRLMARSFISDQSTRSEDEEQLLKSMAEYLAGAWVPMVAEMFRQQKSVLQEHCDSRDTTIASQLISELISVDSEDLPHCCATAMVDGRKVSVKEAFRSALKELLAFQRPGAVSEAFLVQNGQRNQNQLVRPEEVMKEGMRAFIDGVAAHLGTQRGFKSLIGVGLLQLAHFFALDGKVQLCHSDDDEDSDGPHRCQVAYADVVRNVLDLSSTQARGAQVDGLLVNILQTMRAAMYLAEPAHPHLSIDEMEDRWAACMRDEKMEKKMEPKPAMLSWVQNKFDSLGCTAAAVRLLNHECKEVQLNALRLMLALLQSGNDKVQNNVRQLFVSKSGRGALQRLKSIISGGVELISVNYKRSVKTRKHSEKLVYLSRTYTEPEPPEKTEKHGSGRTSFGRRSLLMLALRVVQLLMEGQNAALQNQVAKAYGGTSAFDQCIRLFLAIQPVLGNNFSNQDSELAVLCIQVVETVSECIQGPNRANQQILLSSNFFAAVNRLLCSITYTPQGSDTASMTGLPLQTNDLKCWLKFSLLGCCIAVFEAVRDVSELQGFFELVHARNIISQITASAQVLGFPLSSAQIRNTTASSATKLRKLEDGGNSVRTPSAQQQMDSTRWSSNAETNLNTMDPRSLFTRARASGEWMQSMRASTIKPEKRTKKEEKRETFHIEQYWRSSFSAPDSDDAMLDEILRLYIVLLMFKEYSNDTAHAIRIQQFEEEEPGLSRFLSMHTTHIECIRPSTHHAAKPLAEKVFFALRPELALLIRSKRFRMKASLEIFNVPRDNPWEKGCEFMKRIKIVHNRVHWLEVIRQSAFLNRCIAWRGRLDSAPLRLSGVITLLLLAVYGLPWDPNAETIFGGGGFFSFDGGVAGYRTTIYPFVNLTSAPRPGTTYGEIMSHLDNSLKYRLSLRNRWDHPDDWKAFPWARDLVYALAILHVFLTALACFLHLIIDFPLTFIACIDTKRASKAKASRYQDAQIAETDSINNLPPIPQPPETYVSWGALRALVWQSKITIYYAYLLSVSILGVASSPFFLVMFLLDAFRGVSGALVVRSLVVGGPNLVRTFLLAIVVLVCFGFISYAYFSVIINGEQELCHSPYQCVAMHLLDSFTGDLTTVLGDDLGDFAFPGTALWSGGWESWRTFIVVVSIVAWVFLLQGIIQGQIIDAFAEIRNKMQQARDDLERKCFVSSVDRFMFQNYPGEWDKRKSGKFAWNYLLYFSHLRRKDPEEYNGMDHLAVKAFEEERADLLPIGTFVAKQRDELSHRDSNLQEVVEQYKSELARLHAVTSSLLAQHSANAGARIGPDHPSPSPRHQNGSPPKVFRPGQAFDKNPLPDVAPPAGSESMAESEMESEIERASERPPLWLASRHARSRTVAEELIDVARSDGEGESGTASGTATEAEDPALSPSHELRQLRRASPEPEWEIVGQLASLTHHRSVEPGGLLNRSNDGSERAIRSYNDVSNRSNDGGNRSFDLVNRSADGSGPINRIASDASYDEGSAMDSGGQGPYTYSTFADRLALEREASDMASRSGSPVERRPVPSAAEDEAGGDDDDSDGLLSSWI